MKTLTIVDTFGFFFRLYYAMTSLKSKDGKPSGMVNGFANFIMNLKDEFRSDYIIFALDSKGKTFRSEIDPNYKMNRISPPEDLKEQLVVCIDMIEKMGLYSLSKEGYEADDIIASVVKKFKNDMQINIVTHDKDLYQLISDNVSIYSAAKKELYDRNGCFEKYGVYPQQMIDFLAICGDSADNIPGIKGIGEKGAKKLLDEFKNLEEIYSNLSLIRNERTRNLLIEGKENAFLSKKLASLYDDLEIPDIKKAEFPKYNPLLNVIDILKDYSLNRIISNLQTKTDKVISSFEPVLILDEETLNELLYDINEDTLISFDTETTSIDSKNADIVGFSFCFNDTKSYYVPLAHKYLGAPKQVSLQTAKWAVEQIFKGYVIGQNLKYDFNIVKNCLGVNLPQKYADTMILAWLDNPELSVGMDNLAKRLYDYDTIKFEEVVKKGENFASIDVQSALKYASEDAWITLKFFNTLKNSLDENLFNLACNLEFPFIKVLLDMENNGIKLNLEKLKELISSNEKNLKTLTDEIYEMSGEKFNINSPKQLGEVLFEKLKLPTSKKTKTGYSTNENVLNSLLKEHPVIEKILSYRELYKLQSTYCEPLFSLAMKDKENKVFTNFIQTGTATGRLSSKNPNLQNIPARGSLAKQMREVFEASSGYKLISLDYSQIELRLLAHFSKDPALLEAFKNDEDIHSRTAISIFGSSEGEYRAIAKSINFGLIYGMGSNKLANQINISKSEAKEYIEKYFQAFSTIKDFLENIKNDTKNSGFTTTLLGRKRYFDFSKATPMQLAAYEREAVNTKFQGSAADIIKLAMFEISKYLNKDIKMLLQIHDELVFEVKNELIDEFAIKAQNIMQNIIKLNVPLKTSLNMANNWGDLK
ncbi:DNA polymerase I [Campylobacter sp. RM12327]|uniref:DNA polymerase I n=1 Tax=Campylobacter sputorum TaxID=206 RepID=UPI000B7989B2|nr:MULTISPECIES: DNA polymerase I [Campylobacter]ASM39552.1 DNA polymerase I, 5' --> 3' polymerase, 5' --> 3' and 3' --> 5' exonuclease [Campylobacter sputorum]MBE7358687.1 DNA polymerase I [Campylobacter sp. RM11302]MBF6669809.1 DNA polymerase I [Campylobacter sp. RM12327]MBF6675011.1 DNA polymerase I [Campylobacter sp. RM13538]MBF6676555.1 DNA polymerase I [Campylobacter sp. RM12321]